MAVPKQMNKGVAGIAKVAPSQKLFTALRGIQPQCTENQPKIKEPLVAGEICKSKSRATKQYFGMKTTIYTMVYQHYL